MVQANSFLNFFKQLLRGAGPALRPLPCRPPQRAPDSARRATRDLGEAVWPQAGADSENGPRAESKALAGRNGLRRRRQECARGPRGWRPAPPTPPRPPPSCESCGYQLRPQGARPLPRFPGQTAGRWGRTDGAGRRPLGTGTQRAGHGAARRLRPPPPARRPGRQGVSRLRFQHKSRTTPLEGRTSHPCVAPGATSSLPRLGVNSSFKEVAGSSHPGRRIKAKQGGARHPGVGGDGWTDPRSPRVP